MGKEEEEQGSSPLLGKKEQQYHPGCPGCAHDRRKEVQRGMPYREFLYVWIICPTADVDSSPCNLSVDGFWERFCFQLRISL